MTPVALDLPVDALLPPASAGPLWTYLVGVGLLGVGLGAVLLAMFVTARVLAAAQAHENEERRERAARPLSAGPSRVVFGRVDVDGPDDVAVEVDIEQDVRDHRSKNSTWHTWVERARRTRAAPFYLVRPDGVSVYVEPGAELLVVDSLATSYPNDMPRARVRSADVRRGEEFFVYGDLHRGPHPRAREGYRDGEGFVLRAPRTGKMLMATEVMRDRYGPRVSYLYKAGTIVTIAYLALHGLFTLPFVTASLFGTVTTAEVTGTRTWVTHGKHGSTTHYEITARAVDGFTLAQEVTSGAHYAASRMRLTEQPCSVPMLRTFDWAPASYLGTRPYAPLPWLLAGSIAMALLLAGLRTSYLVRRAWYDKPKLVERGGAGRWVETRPHSAIDPLVN